MEFIALKPCPKCGGKIEGYSSGSKFIFFMRCMNCRTEYSLKTPIVLHRNSATKITKSSIGRAYKEWNAMAHKENNLPPQADREDGKDGV